jgi:hypothetical protein
MEELNPIRGGASASRSLAAPRERSVARGGLTRR